jgi:hypothetical protein
MAMDMGFDSFKDSFMIRPLLFFLFFLGFLAFLVDISVSVSVSGTDSFSTSDIGQSLFKICMIGGNGCFKGGCFGSK